MKLSLAENNAFESLQHVVTTLKLRVTSNTIRERMYYHPLSPSLAAMSDLMTEWKIPNLATRITAEQLLTAPLPCIAFMESDGGFFAPIRKVSLEDGVEWLDTKRGWRKESYDEFMEHWHGIALLFEAKPDSQETNYRERLRMQHQKGIQAAFLILGAVTVLSIFVVEHGHALWNAPLHLWVLFLIKSAGIFTAVLLLLQTVGIDNSIVRSVCGVDRLNQCNSILNSRASKLLPWLSWSEVGFFYFTGSAIFLVVSVLNDTPATGMILYTINLFTLPYTLFSLWYQGRIAKQWCRLCVTVQGLLWAEFAVGYAAGTQIAPSNVTEYLPLLIPAFLLPCILWLSFKHFLVGAQLEYPLRRELYKVKFNAHYVDSLLKKQPLMFPILDGMKTIFLGDKKASFTLTVVTNPFCGPCIRLHSDLEDLLAVTKDIKIQFVFSGQGQSKIVADTLLRVSEQDLPLVMRNWYTGNTRDANEWYEYWSNQLNLDTSENELISHHTEWCELASIKATPTLFLNGIELPIMYSVADLPDLLRVLQTTQIEKVSFSEFK